MLICYPITGMPKCQLKTYFFFSSWNMFLIQFKRQVNRKSVLTNIHPAHFEFYVLKDYLFHYSLAYIKQLVVLNFLCLTQEPVVWIIHNWKLKSSTAGKMEDISIAFSMAFFFFRKSIFLLAQETLIPLVFLCWNCLIVCLFFIF